MIYDITRRLSIEEQDRLDDIQERLCMQESHHIDYSRYPDAPYWGDGENINDDPDDPEGYVDGKFIEWIDNLINDDDISWIEWLQHDVDFMTQALMNNGYAIAFEKTRLSTKELAYLQLRDNYRWHYIYNPKNDSHTFLSKIDDIDEYYLFKSKMSYSQPPDVMEHVKKKWYSVNYSKYSSVSSKYLKLMEWINSWTNDYIHTYNTIYFLKAKDAVYFKMMLTNNEEF